MIFSAPDLPIQSDRWQYNFGPFSLRPDGTLVRGSAVIPLQLKELDLLRALIAKAGQIVPVAELRRAAWGNVHVSPESLPRCISSLRARLEPEDCILTVYKQGYRFELPVKRVQLDNHPFSEEDAPGHPSSKTSGKTRALPRLVILPLSTGPGVPEYLGPGIAEETMLRLGRTRTPVVSVIARDSVFTLVAQGRTAQEVGSALRAELALTGTISALPTHFRLRIEMIRVTDAVQLWAEDFLVLRSLLSYADARLAKRITARIHETFASPIARVPATDATRLDAPAVIASREANRSQAYSIHMQARSNWATFERVRMQDAIHAFHHALELDPGLIPARTELLHSYLALASFGYMRAEKAAELARKEAEMLIAIAPNEQSVHSALGWIHFFHDRDMDAAAASFARPQRSTPSLWDTVYQVRFALGQGRLGEAVRILRSALEADPYAPALHWRLTWALHLAGEAEAALEQAKRTVALFPSDPGALFFSSIVFAASSGRDIANGKTRTEGGGLAEQAVALAYRLTQLAPTLDSGFVTLAYAHARMGHIAEARAILDRQQWLARERFVMRSFQAPLLVELGEHDAALEALSIAEEQHCPWLFELLGDPRLQPLHGKPEFQRLGDLAGQMFDDDASVA
jgi:DNA-binding winged helix-turn-helix (wHTH) protein/tetratricopeptide (TPR) repeat protein